MHNRIPMDDDAALEARIAAAREALVAAPAGEARRRAFETFRALHRQRSELQVTAMEIRQGLYCVR